MTIFCQPCYDLFAHFKCLEPDDEVGEPCWQCAVVDEVDSVPARVKEMREWIDANTTD